MRNVQTDKAEPQCDDRERASGGSDWLSWFDAQRRRVDAEISKHLNVLKSQVNARGKIIESVEYSLANGGKRLRPVLVLEACRVCGGDERAAWPAALALECIHTFSLIHDDLPAMDDDALRRGEATNHVVFGEATAILAGDWLTAHAFGLLSSSEIEADTAAALLAALAAGTRDMIIGQGADIACEGEPADAETVRFIHRHKTASLLEAACVMGAISARASETHKQALSEYGQRLGLAFQIIDDLLDCTGAAEKLGKRVGKDADASKQTYPAAFGVEASRKQAEEEISAAIEALEPFGERADNLRGLARFVIARDR